VPVAQTRWSSASLGDEQFAIFSPAVSAIRPSATTASCIIIKMVRIGLMGCGAVADYGHVPAIRAVPGLALTSVFDPQPERAYGMRDKFGIAQAYVDAEKFFDSGIDAVAITSPAPTHLNNVKMAARYGKHVLCEKPLSLSDTDSRSMIDAMQAAGRRLFVGFTYRFSPVALTIKRLVREGAIGRLADLRLIYLWSCHGRYEENDRSRLNLRRAGRMDEGGPMIDCGVHQIDLARWWTGSEVKRIHGTGVWVDDQHAPDHVYAHLTHANDVHTMVEISYSYAHTTPHHPTQFVYELIGTEGLIRYHREDHTFVLTNRDGTQHLEWADEKNFRGMYAEFEQCVSQDRPGEMPTGNDGLIAAQIASRATEQAVAGR
jgi:predicted dehydrogenase